MTLTKRRIDAFTFDPDGPAKQIHWADDLPGFGVRVYASGKRSFVLNYRNAAGRRRFLTIGRYGVLTVQQARAEARSALASAAGGTDPLEERRGGHNGLTLSEFFETYIDRHARPRNKRWRDDRRTFDLYVRGTLGKRKLEDIRRSDVAALHARIGKKTQSRANRTLALLSSMFNRAAEWGHYPETLPNPASRIRKYRERSRDRWIKPDELPHLVIAINEEQSPFTRALFKLFLLTGCRRAELCGLRWKDVDLTRREIRFDDTKAGRSHIVPLSEPAVEILQELPRELGNPYVFPGPKPGTALEPNGATQQWIRIRGRLWLLGNPDAATKLREQAEQEIRKRSKHAAKTEEAVSARLLKLAAKEATAEPDAPRLHDLRRTVGSWLAEAGASLPLIGKVLNHTNPSTTQIYARLSDDPAREALERHGRKIIPIDGKRRSA